MSEAELILILGAIVLACSSGAMLIVCLCSPGLKGTGWLASAFAAGSVTAAFLLVPEWRGLPVIAADLGLLSTLMLLHVAVLKVARSPAIPFWHGAVLLGLQASTDGLQLGGIISGRIRIACVGCLIAVQSVTTARVLWSLGRRKVRAPATFSVVLLLVFGSFNVLRSAGVLLFAQNATLQWRMNLLAFTLFIAVALGLGFGFFWMTTAMLTAEVEHMASTDPLTRLYNRRIFLKWCEKELSRSQRSGMPFSLLMVDLDHFKRINDSFGHHRGDEVLCAAVERMQDSVRGIDVLCRWGGEEFAVLLPNAPGEATWIVAERIRENIQKMNLALARSPAMPALENLRVTVSIGAATYRDLDDDIAGMLLRADRALYRAKSSGRNRVLVAT